MSKDDLQKLLEAPNREQKSSFVSHNFETRAKPTDERDADAAGASATLTWAIGSSASSSLFVTVARDFLIQLRCRSTLPVAEFRPLHVLSSELHGVAGPTSSEATASDHANAMANIAKAMELVRERCISMVEAAA